MLPTKLQTYFFLGLLLTSFIIAFFILKPFLIPLAFAATFAVVLQPLYQGILRTMKNWPSIAAVITIAITLFCIITPVTLLTQQIVGEAGQLYTSLSDGSAQTGVISIVSYAQGLIREFIPGMSSFTPDISEYINTYSRAVLIWVSNHLGSAFTSLITLALDFFIFTIALYYFLRDGGALKQQLILLSPLKDEDDKTIFNRLELAVNSVLRGTIVVAMIQGLVAAIGFTIFGIPNGILWGTFAALTALIPGVGTSLVLIPLIAYLFLTNHATQGVGLIVWGVLAVGMIDNFIGPKLLSRGTQLHPFAILLSVLGGIVFFGPAGIFMGPLSISLLFALLHIYTKLSAQNK